MPASPDPLDSTPAARTDEGFGLAMGDGRTAQDWAAYREFYGRAGDVIRERDDFRVDIVAVPLDRMIVFDRRMRGVRHERRADHVATNGFDHFTLQVNLGGAVEVDVGGGLRPLGDGEAILIDTLQPMRLRMIDVHLLTASIARELVLAAGDGIAHGHRIPPERTATLRAQHAGWANGEPAAIARAGPRLLLATLAMLSESARDGAGGARLRRRVIRRAVIRDHIVANVQRRTLDPAAIADACAVSRATLYRLTAPDGGVASFVRKTRLAELERRLSARRGESLEVLAEQLGFADQSHMSRQFRAVTGTSPGRYRAAPSSAGEADAFHLARRRWEAWMAEFR